MPNILLSFFFFKFYQISFATCELIHQKVKIYVWPLWIPELQYSFLKKCNFVSSCDCNLTKTNLEHLYNLIYIHVYYKVILANNLIKVNTLHYEFSHLSTNLNNSLTISLTLGSQTVLCTTGIDKHSFNTLCITGLQFRFSKLLNSFFGSLLFMNSVLLFGFTEASTSLANFA